MIIFQSSARCYAFIKTYYLYCSRKKNYNKLICTCSRSTMSLRIYQILSIFLIFTINFKTSFAATDEGRNTFYIHLFICHKLLNTHMEIIKVGSRTKS